MQTLALILGIIGTLTGVTSLGIKVYELYNDRARLAVKVEMGLVSNEVSKEFHNQLKITFRNWGRRKITIVEGHIELPAQGAMIGGVYSKPDSSVLNLLGRNPNQKIEVEGMDRAVRVYDPFDASPLRHCGDKATAVFIDALGKEYRDNFLIARLEDAKSPASLTR